MTESPNNAYSMAFIRRRAFPSPSPSCKSPIKDTLRSVLDLITVIILKRMRKYFLSKQQIYSM